MRNFLNEGNHTAYFYRNYTQTKTSITRFRSCRVKWRWKNRSLIGVVWVLRMKIHALIHCVWISWNIYKTEERRNAGICIYRRTDGMWKGEDSFWRRWALTRRSWTILAPPATAWPACWATLFTVREMTFGAPLTSVALLIAERSHEDISSSALNRSNQWRSRHTQKQKERARRIPDRGRRRRRRRRDRWMDGWVTAASIPPFLLLFTVLIPLTACTRRWYVSLTFKTNSHRVSRSWGGGGMLS